MAEGRGGTKPLLLHNVNLANPRNEWARRSPTGII
jgi:hypothetical protein